MKKKTKLTTWIQVFTFKGLAYTKVYKNFFLNNWKQIFIYILPKDSFYITIYKQNTWISLKYYLLNVFDVIFAFVCLLPMQDYLSYPYLLYLQVYCNGYPSPSVGRTVAASGINPTVTLTYSEQSFEGSCSNVLEYTLRGALVSTNDSNQPAVLSNPAWLVPLLFNSHTRSIPICVRTGSTGYDVEPKR